MNYFWEATGVALQALESVIKSHIRVSGIEHIGEGPTLFVANHFTRFEAPLLPWILWRETDGKRVARSLGDSSLFVGALGKYLRNVNVFPKDDPAWRDIIIDDLASGKHDWIIYPEGAMVKHKRLVNEQGKLWLQLPWRSGPPHTGAAVFAMQAELMRQCRCLGDDCDYTPISNEILGDQPVTDLPVKIVPVTITFYPLRPGTNRVEKAVRLFVKELPERAQDELQIEGNLLFGGADIDIHFGEPIELAERVDRMWRRQRLLHPFTNADKVLARTIESGRHALTRDIMRAIYRSTQINLDHLLFTILAYTSDYEIEKHEWLTRSLTAALAIEDRGGWRLHEDTIPQLIQALGGADAPQVDDAIKVATDTGVIDVDDDLVTINHQVLSTEHDFHVQRLRNPCSVIVGEFGAVPEANKLARQCAKRRRWHKAAYAALLHNDQRQFEADYAAFHDHELSKPPEVGRPFLLEARKAQTAIVLSHGYLAAPREVRELAEYLHARGFTVYCPRLPGHGTAPLNLSTITWKDWLHSYLRAMATMALNHDHVIAMGFSTGGLLALQAAARQQEGCNGVVTINAPISLKDSRTKYVKLVRRWNKAAGVLGLENRTKRWVPNNSENPDTNYSRNYLHGVCELLDLMHDTEERLADVNCRALIIQGDEDPVVSPTSGQEIHDQIGSDRRTLLWLPRQRHTIVRGEDTPELFAEVAGFATALERARTAR